MPIGGAEMINKWLISQFWYHKSTADTKQRFQNHGEM